MQESDCEKRCVQLLCEMSSTRTKVRPGGKRPFKRLRASSSLTSEGAATSSIGKLRGFATINGSIAFRNEEIGSANTDKDENTEKGSAME